MIASPRGAPWAPEAAAPCAPARGWARGGPRTGCLRYVSCSRSP